MTAGTNHPSRRIGFVVFVYVACTFISTLSYLRGQPVGSRPKVLRIAHVALYVSDLNKARWFYRTFLGFGEPFALKGTDGNDHIAFIKVNDDQFIELFAENRRNDGSLSHIALLTDDAMMMRQYLVARGAPVVDEVHQGKAGNYFFTAVDPDGHLIEIVQEATGNWFAQNRGSSISPGRISDRITHVTISVRSAGAAIHFYRDILGFREFSRGGSENDRESWISLRLPDGEDYVELSLQQDSQPENERRAQNYLCLERDDLPAAVSILQSRSGSSYRLPMVIQIGKEHRRRTSLFDPDGARIDLMEPTVAEDKAALFSSTPPPH